MLYKQVWFFYLAEKSVLYIIVLTNFILLQTLRTFTGKTK